MKSIHPESYNAGNVSNWYELILKIKNRKRALTTRLGRIAGSILGAATVLLTGNQASAQNSANADAVYNGYLSAYLMTTNESSHSYPLPYICQSLSNRDLAFMWQQAYMISGLEDDYDRTHSSSHLSLISSLLTGFLAQNITNLTWDTWNDDIEWACIALAHGYQETGNANFLSGAELNWNAVWSRGWDTTLGGGIWETTSDPSKVVVCNAPFVIAGCMLYQSTGNSTYLTESEQVYAWMRSQLFNTSTGQIIEGLSSSGSQLVSDNSYNSGIFLQAANALYQITGQSQYYSDALLAANHVVNNHTVMTADYVNNGPFGSEEFFRGLSLFARQNNLWMTYYPWLETNCTAAWNHRRTDYNITWNNYEANTPTTNVLAMETISSLIVQAVTQISPFDPAYELQNVSSGQGLAVQNASKSTNAPIIQWPINGSANSLWSFTTTDSGYYQIVNQLSGMDAAVFDASTKNGTNIIQAPFGSAQNDQWSLSQNSDGSFTLNNRRSSLVLEDPGSSTTQGIQMDQWASNGGANQHWNLISHLLPSGNYELQNVASGQALNVSGNAMTNGAAIVQWPFSGSANSLWAFTATTNGYYQIVSQSSGNDVAVKNAATSQGALIVQWTFGSAGNDQWFLSPNSDGSYTIFNLHSGMALEDPGSSTAQGTQMDQWPYNGGDNQHWNLISQ